MEEGWDAVNLERARDLAAGRPLAPLPPAAFHTRSARGRGAPPEDGGEAPAEVGPDGSGHDDGHDDPGHDDGDGPAEPRASAGPAQQTTADEAAATR